MFNDIPGVRITIKRIKNMDKYIRRLLILSIIDILYIAYVAYMTYSIHSPLPFARVEEIVTAAIILLVFVVIALIRWRYIAKKNR